VKPIEIRDSQPIRNATYHLDEVWKGIKYKIIQKDFSYISLLKENIGGDLLFVGFEFQENDTFDWYCSRGRLDEIKFNDYFLLSENVLNQFPDQAYYADGKQRQRATSKIDKEPKFEWVNELCIDGELASLLYHGGANPSNYKGSIKEIKQLAQEFCNELFEQEYRYEYVRCYKSSQAWNSWFNDFIIDETMLIICMKTRTIWLLAFTDTD
jgi:hypothetical protein